MLTLGPCDSSAHSQGVMPAPPPRPRLPESSGLQPNQGSWPRGCVGPLIRQQVLEALFRKL